MQVDWELSKTIPSVDGQGVRCACVLPGGRLILGTQGGGLMGVSLPSGDLEPIPYQHNHAVTALLTSYDGSFYVTACKDAAIRWFDATTHTLLGTLEGQHEKPVTSLDWVAASTNGSTMDALSYYLVSGSWDGTAKVWNLSNQSLVATLPGHENSTCVLGLQSTEPGILNIATGSAGVAQNNAIQGHTVRLWKVDTATGQVQMVTSVANDHEGPIRGICRVVDDKLATCSNDGSVKLRSATTAVTNATLGFIAQSSNPSHPPMLLTVGSLNDGTVMAGAEDGHVVVWSTDAVSGSGNGPQLILHTTSVWNVLAVPMSKDNNTGMEEEDFATCCDDGNLRIFTRATDRMAPEAERQAFLEQVTAARQKSQGGPSPEEVARLPHWETNLQVKGNSEGQVHLFQKDGVAIAAQWSMATQSWTEVGQVMGNAGDGNGQGQSTIDGVSYDHVLPIEVDQTGGGVANLQIGYNNGENPFVAAQRFIDAHMLPQHHLSEIANYIEQRVGSTAPTLGMASTATAPVATTGTPIVSFEYMPAKAYCSFELASEKVIDKIKAKLEESHKASSISNAQWTLLETLMSTLQATNRYHASKISPAELDVLNDMLTSLAEPFPLLDLARMAALHPDAATHVACWTRIISSALELCAKQPPNAVPVPMLTLRLAANVFRGGALAAVASHTPMILDQAQRYVSSGNKNVRLSVATVLHNIALYVQKTPSSYTPTLVPLCDKILQSKLYDETGVMRTLVALGTLLLAVPESKAAANGLYLASKVEPAASPHSAACKAAAKEVYALLQ